MSDTRKNKISQEPLKPLKNAERGFFKRFRNDFEEILIKLKCNDPHLTSINFTDHDYINHDDIVALSEALKHNQVVTCLNLTNNNINSHGAKVLAEILKRNKTLAVIILDGNNIGCTGVKEIVNAVQHDRTRLLHVQLLDQGYTKKEQDYGNKINDKFTNFGRGIYSYEAALIAMERLIRVERETKKKLVELRKKKSQVTFKALCHLQKKNDDFTCDIDTTLVHPIDINPEKLDQFTEENKKRIKTKRMQQWALPLIAFMQSFKQYIYDNDRQEKCHAGQLPPELLLKIISFTHLRHPGENPSSIHRLFSVVQKHRLNKITSDVSSPSEVASRKKQQLAK